MIQYLEQHRDELKKTISRIKQRIEQNRKPKLNPYSICVDILKQIKQLEKRKAHRTFIADKIRKLHDFYGWMSKGCIDDNGLCSGSIYRTEKYMQIPLNERTGKKTTTLGFQRVHIEHSVPINEIYNLLQFKKDQLNSPKAVFDLIFENSVCTAFSNEEEKTGIRTGYSRKLVEASLINRDRIFPLKRYSENVKVINILTGSTVPHNTSLKTLTMDYKDIEIYDWNIIEDHYKNRTTHSSR